MYQKTINDERGKKEMEKNFYDMEEIRQNVFNCKLSKAYLYLMVKEGKIQTRRFGKKILVPASEVERLMVGVR